MTQFSIADRARQVFRITLCGVWTALCYTVWLLGALITRASPRATQRWNSLSIRWWTRGLLQALSFTVETRGRVPAKPFFLVANHLGYMDILVLGSRLGSTFVSKSELGSWPVLGHLARVTGTIFIDREKKRDAVRVLGEIDAAIDRGAGVVVFPEGTSSRGDSVYPLKTALLQWAAERQFPVHAATLTYTTSDPVRSADQVVCWWGEMTFVPHLLQLLALRGVHAVVDFDPVPIVESERGRLASRLHESLQRRFVPVTSAEVT